MRTGLSLLCGVLAWTLFLPHAAAHILPYSTDFVRDPLDENHLAVNLSRGYIVSADGGKTWNVLCAGQVGLDPTALEPAPIIAGRDGWIIGASTGLWLVDWNGCGAKHVEGPVKDRFVIELVTERGADPASAKMFALVQGVLQTSDAGSTSQDGDVFESDDAGRTWAALGAPLKAGIPNHLRVVAGEKAQLCVSAAFAETDTVGHYLLRSADGGATWSKVRVSDTDVQILDIDRNDPNRILVGIRTPMQYEVVNRSDDGGATFKPLQEVPFLGGAVFSDDGKIVWIGSTQGKLFQVVGDGQATLMPGHATFRCLIARGDTLLACGENWIDDFVVGISEDQGVSFKPLIRLQDAKSIVPCSDPGLESTCAFEWMEWQLEVIMLAENIARAKDRAAMQDAAVPTVADGGTPDAGAPKGDGSTKPPAKRDGGGGCAVAFEGRSHTGCSWTLIGLIAVACARRRSMQTRARRKPRRTAPSQALTTYGARDGSGV
jgi:photosystem II stability/assembly factor-like uncharacterized protein